MTEREEPRGKRREFREVYEWRKLKHYKRITIKFEDAATDDGGFIKLDRPVQTRRSLTGGTLR